MRHTPTRWRVTRQGDIAARPHDLIAAVRFLGGDNAEGKANARLMASAPELLQALIQLEACSELNGDEMEPETLEVLALARKIIAKAQGVRP